MNGFDESHDDEGLERLVNALVGLNEFDLAQLGMLSAPRLVREAMMMIVVMTRKMVRTRGGCHKMS